MSRQLINSKPKVIIGMAHQTELLQKACKLADQHETKIFAVKTESKQSVEQGTVDFFEVIATKG